MLARIRKLKAAGVLGINSRNGSYLAPLNPRKLYRLVDDKLETKKLAGGANIAVPELYGVIHTVHESAGLLDIIEKKNDFVIKPAQGSGGNGILVIEGRRKDLYFKPDGSALDIYQLRHHVENILGGIYSLGGHIDNAIIEYRVRFDPVFKSISYQGVPDIRILVYRGVPVMSMLRLPTRMSDGKANLHKGAVGAGIDLATGLTTYAVCQDRRISEHPDFGAPLNNVAIPGWDNLLLLAARCYELAPLGYLGVDLVLDAKLGPLVLELNARPGLSIQIANGEGLQPRFAAVDACATLPTRPEERVLLAKTLMSR